MDHIHARSIGFLIKKLKINQLTNYKLASYVH